MNYDHDIEVAGNLAGVAISRMQNDGIAPYPQNFEVWYAYYSNSHPEMKRSMDELMKKKIKISSQDCRNFYDQFLNDLKKQEAYQKASDQIHATLRDVSGLMNNVKDATGEYSETLQGVSDRITNVKKPEEMEAVLKSVVLDTNRMMEHNKKLQVQLDLSAIAMEELKRDMDRVRQEALTDGLTSLANRKAFDEHVARLARGCAHGPQTFTLLMVDIDHFKSFNDNFGHQVGDQVLRLVARTLTDGVKGRDIAARYGGEEFAILLPETNLEAGIVVGNALRKALANKEIVNRANGELLGRITMSVGVAQYYPEELVEDLIGRADAALYTAKHNGRNQVAAAPTPHDKNMQEEPAGKHKDRS